MRKILTMATVLSMLIASANNIDEAKKLYQQGEYDKAMTLLEQLVGKQPKDPAVNYYLGATYYKKGYYNAAANYLKVAENGNWAAAARDLAELNLRVYDLDGAAESLERWEAILDKAKKPYPAEIAEIRSRVMMARNMLERVEKIDIVDVIDVDSVDFYKYYRLSADAGELLDGRSLPDEYAAAMPKVVYHPQSYKEMIWGQPGKDGHTQIMIADILDDGTVTEPHSIGAEINEGTESPDYPFIAEDGVTVYFAAKGDDSLGGYDIFMTRRSPEGELLNPQNIGMPYNSPYNDYMMVIDESNDLGWFASDRKHLPGKVTIYAFRPSKMRVNHDSNSPNIAKLALLEDAKPLDDPDQYMPSGDDSYDSQQEFFFPLGNGQVYTRISDFRNPKARQAMEQLLKRMFDLEVMQVQLDDLRQSYANGDKNAAPEILKLEKNLNEAPDALERLTNQIISIETRTITM